MSLEFLWYIPNTVEAAHRGDDEANQRTSLGLSAELTRSAENGDQLLSRLRDPVTS